MTGPVCVFLWERGNWGGLEFWQEWEAADRLLAFHHLILNLISLFNDNSVCLCSSSTPVSSSWLPWVSPVWPWFLHRACPTCFPCWCLRLLSYTFWGHSYISTLSSLADHRAKKARRKITDWCQGQWFTRDFFCIDIEKYWNTETRLLLMGAKAHSIPFHWEYYSDVDQKFFLQNVDQQWLMKECNSKSCMLDLEAAR